jgi:hypothetical protein
MSVYVFTCTHITSKTELYVTSIVAMLKLAHALMTLLSTFYREILF